MEFEWDDLNDLKGNLHHVISGHPEMRSSRFIETVFSSASGDEEFYTSRRGRQTFLVVEKTHRKKLYRIVFEKKGAVIRVKTAHPISKRRS